MIANIVRRLAVCNLPENHTFIEIDRADASVWRFDQRQSLDGQASARVLGGRRRWSAIGSGIGASTSAGAGTGGCVALNPRKIAGQFGIAGHKAERTHL